jgi:hypothetical protein
MVSELQKELEKIKSEADDRLGRLMHSESDDIRHDIIMTEREISSYGKRLWSLQEKGFTVKVVGE